MITSGEGKYKVWLEEKKLDDGIIYILGGGEKSHIGGVVICESNKETNVIKMDNHFDYIVLKIIAEKICRKNNNKIIVIGGIHIDNASKEDIDKIIENCRRLAECI